MTTRIYLLKWLT